MPHCPPVVCDVERWLHRGKNNRVAGVALDSWDRWGPKTEEHVADANALGTRLWERKVRVEEGLKQAVTTLDAKHRTLLAEAHITLLQDVIARRTAEAASSAMSRTAIPVANEEIKAWRDFADDGGELPRQNGHYIHYDSDLYAELFGDLTEHSSDDVGASIIGAGLPDWRQW